MTSSWVMSNHYQSWLMTDSAALSIRLKCTFNMFLDMLSAFRLSMRKTWEFIFSFSRVCLISRLCSFRYCCPAFFQSTVYIVLSLWNITANALEIVYFVMMYFSESALYSFGYILLLIFTFPEVETLFSLLFLFLKFRISGIRYLSRVLSFLLVIIWIYLCIWLWKVYV